MNDKNKGSIDFTGTNQAQRDAIAAAKSKKVPIGVTPMPAVMPRLDQPPPNPQAGVQSVRAAQRILTPEEQQKLIEQGKFISGAGSAYAINQPPVPTDTEGQQQTVDPRTAPRPPGSGLREDTVKGLQAISAANATEDDEELVKINKDIEDKDDVYEENEFGEYVRSLLRNKKRAAAIESRCAPMAFEELLMEGSVKQKVPIIPGKFEPVFRSLLGEENEEILRLMGSVRGPEQYILDVMSLYNLTAGIHSINNRVLPTHIDNNGDFNEEMFRAKYKMVRKMALPILADMSVNFRWFIARVQKLTVVDDIKSF